MSFDYSNPVPAILFGLFLLIFGGGAMYLELAAARRRQQEVMEPLERTYYRRQHRRRLQVAGMIILIGFMIPVGDSLIPWENAKVSCILYWTTVLGLAFWTILLALGDMLSTKMYSRVSLRRLEQQRAELEQAAEKLRKARADRDAGR